MNHNAFHWVEITSLFGVGGGFGKGIMGWVGLGWAGLGWAGPGWVGIEWKGIDNKYRNK